MKEEQMTLAVKTAGAAVAPIAAFGLTWWAIAAAIAGAFASLHFEKEAPPSTLLKLLLKILALSVLAAGLAVAAPSLPGFGWTENILLAVRALLLGAFVSPIYDLVRRLLANFKAGG